MNLKQRAKQLKTDIPAIFLCMKHKKTPWPAKFVAGMAVIYALSPIDLIPDFIPVLGYLDDVLILPALIALAIKLVPHEILEQCRVKAAGMWENGRPVQWYYAIPILLIWLIVISVLFRILIPIIL